MGYIFSNVTISFWGEISQTRRASLGLTQRCGSQKSVNTAASMTSGLIIKPDTVAAHL